SPPASSPPARYPCEATAASSRPSRAGTCVSHQQTSRISRLGSAFGSQPGQYDRGTGGLADGRSVRDPSRELRLTTTPPPGVTLARGALERENLRRASRPRKGGPWHGCPIRSIR